MTDFRRDALLAACCGAVLLGLLVVVDALAALSNPVGVVGGVLVAVAVEVAFLVETSVADWWGRPLVPVLCSLALVAGVLVAAVAVGPVVVAGACWGLVTYFAFLVLAVTGHWP